MLSLLRKHPSSQPQALRRHVSFLDGHDNPIYSEEFIQHYSNKYLDDRALLPRCAQLRMLPGDQLPLHLPEV